MIHARCAWVWICIWNLVHIIGVNSRTNCTPREVPITYCAPVWPGGSKWSNPLYHTPVHPITYAIPEQLVVQSIPRNKTGTAKLVGQFSENRFPCSDVGQAQYYQTFTSSYYAYTSRKDGWACMRHYEILARGGVPYFAGLDQSPQYSLWDFPRDLIQQLMALPGVGLEEPKHKDDDPQVTLDMHVFDPRQYYPLADKLLEYTRTHLTTRAMAEHFLRTTGHVGAQSGLMLLMKSAGPKLYDYVGYTFQLLMHGLRTVMGPALVDYPRLWLMYDWDPDVQRHRTQEARDRKRKAIYGCGFSYAFTLGSDRKVWRGNLSARIRAREFKFVVYPLRRPPQLRTWRLLHWDLVKRHYQKHEIIFIDVEDDVDHTCRTQGRNCHRAAERNKMMQLYAREGTVFRTNP